MNSDKQREREASDLIIEAEYEAKSIKDRANRIASRLVQNGAEEDRLFTILEKHFSDDRDFQKSTADQFKSLKELTELNGEHLSYFNKNLIEVKTMLLEQNKVTESQYKQMKPVIDKFEANTQGIAFIKGKSVVFISVAGAIITFASAWYIVVNFIKNSIESIK